jgi:hypothetical protein
MWWWLLLKYGLGACTTSGGTPNELQHDTRANSPTNGVVAPKQNLNADLFRRFPLTPNDFLSWFQLGWKAYLLSFPPI